jgi:hypothetical protein
MGAEVAKAPGNGTYTIVTTNQRRALQPIGLNSHKGDYPMKAKALFLLSRTSGQQYEHMECYEFRHLFAAQSVRRRARMPLQILAPAALLFLISLSIVWASRLMLWP